jgi:hypothetical protein
MKLGTKLLAAPLLTALVVLGVGQVNIALMSRAANANHSASQIDLEELRKIAGVQDKLGLAHASVYRTVALMASLDDAKIKAFRGDLARQVQALKPELSRVLADPRADDGLRAAVAQSIALLDKYLSQADQAIDLASVDPNTGIAALQGADASFAALKQSVHQIVERLDSASLASFTAASQVSSRNALLLALGGALVAALAVGLSWVMQRRSATCRTPCAASCPRCASPPSRSGWPRPKWPLATRT